MSNPVVIGNAELWLGDAREILPVLTGFDAVVTDIPYEVSQVSGGLRDIDFGEWDEAGSGAAAMDALSLCRTVPSVLVFCEWRQTAAVSDLFKGRSSRLLAWIKTNPTVMNGQHLFLPAMETAYYGKLPGAWFGGNCIKSVWHGPAPTEREHPTQKPLGLMKWAVVNTVAPNAVCLDAFMGSGTTGVACTHLGRRFVGIEKSPAHFATACRRIEQAYRQADLFIEPPKPSPIQATLEGV